MNFENVQVHESLQGILLRLRRMRRFHLVLFHLYHDTHKWDEWNTSKLLCPAGVKHAYTGVHPSE